MVSTYSAFRISGWLALVSGIVLTGLLIRPEPFASLFPVWLGCIVLTPALGRLRERDPLFVSISRTMKIAVRVFSTGVVVLLVSLPTGLVLCTRWCVPYAILLAIGFVLVVTGDLIPFVRLMTRRKTLGKGSGQST